MVNANLLPKADYLSLAQRQETAETTGLVLTKGSKGHPPALLKEVCQKKKMLNDPVFRRIPRLQTISSHFVFFLESYIFET